MKDKLSVVVIGCGAIAQRRHLPEYHHRTDVEIVAVVDPNAARAKEQAGKFGVPNVFADYKAALKLGPDLVSVCSPNAFHAEQTIAALKAGAHVLVEKPMAVSMPQARAMVKTARAARRQLMVGQNQRMAASHVRGRQIYESGLLGKCLGFRATFAHGGPENWSVDGLKCHFFKKDQAVLGAMADLGVHKLDLLRYLLGEDFVTAAGFYGRLDKGSRCEVEDAAFAALTTAGGAMGSLHASWMYKSGCDNSTVLYCQKGTLRLEDDRQYSVIVEMHNGERQFISTKASGTTKDNQSGSGVIDAFVNAVRSGRPVPITGEDAARSLAAVLACIESADTGRIVKVAQV
jgi:predicted dehydrogenase